MPDDPIDVSEPDFGLRLGREDGVAQIALRGEIDLATAQYVDDAVDLVDLQGAGEVYLSLADVTFIDSSGLHALFRAHDRLTSQGRSLVIIEIPPRIFRILRLAGLDRVLTLR